MKKQILKISGIALVAVIALTSCSKKVSSRKLDGDWKVTSGEGTMSTPFSSLQISSTYSFNGSVETVTTGSTSSSSNVSMSYSFDKKNGTYTKTTISTQVDTNTAVYYSASTTSNYNTYEGELNAITTTTSTQVENGTYTITGGTGDIKSNSQIVFVETSNTNTTNLSIAYYDGVTAFNVSNYYAQSTGTTKLVTSSTATSSGTKDSSDGTVVNVESIKKGEMTIKINTSSTSTSNSVTTTNTDERTFVLEKQ